LIVSQIVVDVLENLKMADPTAAGKRWRELMSMRNAGNELNVRKSAFLSDESRAWRGCKAVPLGAVA
jgi:hypothetical protein